jgi:peptidyl-tRNA hydrolase, PTH2 family
MSAKQVIVIRKDLKMRSGKIAAQAAHASMKVLLDAGEFHTAHGRWFELDEDDFGKYGVDVFDWIAGNHKKVVVYVESEDALVALYDKAKEAKLPCSLITDAGLTEFHGVPTKTCIAVGPALESEVDKITGGLPLL